MELIVGQNAPRMREAHKTVAFSGAAGNGAIGTVALFTVTGRVWIDAIVPFCTEDLVGATATLAVGTASQTAGILAALTATDLQANEFWLNSTPAAGAINTSHSALGTTSTGLIWKLVSESIIATVATAAITDGTIIFDVIWRPLSSGATLVAA